jgi:hypothetical protein
MPWGRWMRQLRMRRPIRESARIPGAVNAGDFSRGFPPGTVTFPQEEGVPNPAAVRRPDGTRDVTWTLEVRPARAVD